jgi:hypothetical protein
MPKKHTGPKISKAMLMLPDAGMSISGVAEQTGINYPKLKRLLS